MRQRLYRAAAVVLLAMLIGCTSPPTELYVLAAVPGPTVATAARGIELRRIGIAGYLDRPEIVRSNADYRLTVTDTARWAEPVGSMIDRVLTEDLVERLPSTAVFAESGAISTQPDLVLQIDIQRFDADGSGTVVLLAQVAVRHEQSGVASEARTIRLTATPASPSTRDLIGAMSAALGQLADRVAAMVQR